MLAGWLLGAMTRILPPATTAADALPYTDRSGQVRRETVDERSARYDVIGAITARVVIEDVDGAVDDHGALTYAAYDVASKAAGAFIHESRLDPDVYYGPCAKVRGRCPGGAVCIAQIEMASWERTREGWSRADIAADPAKCIREAVRRIRGSEGKCAREQRAAGINQPPWLLSAYASGNCDDGHKASAEILNIAFRVAMTPRPRPTPPTVIVQTTVGAVARQP